MEFSSVSEYYFKFQNAKSFVSNLKIIQLFGVSFYTDTITLQYKVFDVL